MGTWKEKVFQQEALFTTVVISLLLQNKYSPSTYSEMHLRFHDVHN
jgi:hypothetical protein